MQTFLQELRYGARMLMRQPGLASVTVITLALSFGSSLTQTLAQNVPLRIEDVFSMKSFNPNKPIDLSPDGQFVAYAIEDSSKKQQGGVGAFTQTGTPKVFTGSEVRITELKTGISINVGAKKGSSWGPVWSPDSNYLAFYSDRGGRAHLWIWERRTRRLRQLSDAVTRGFVFDDIRWTPDSRQVLVKLLPNAMPLTEAENPGDPSAQQDAGQRGASALTVQIHEFPPKPSSSNQSADRSGRTTTALLSANRADLALIDAQSGQVRRIAQGYSPTWIGSSPDGAHVAFAAYTGSYLDNVTFHSR